MHDLKLGELITGAANRDAIHVAVCPIEAAEHLLPAMHVGLTEDGRASHRIAPHVGIVDPYLTDAVKTSQRFYLFLYPNTVTSLRHEWTHPAFPAAAPAPTPAPPATISAEAHASASVKWLLEFAAELGLSYDALLEAADKYVRYGDYTVQYGSQGWRDNFYGREKDFWHNYHVATGRKPDNMDGNPFCCTC